VSRQTTACTHHCCQLLHFPYSFRVSCFCAAVFCHHGDRPVPHVDPPVRDTDRTGVRHDTCKTNRPTRVITPIRFFHYFATPYQLRVIWCHTRSEYNTFRSVSSATLAVTETVHDRMVGRLVDSELDGIWKEMAVAFMPIEKSRGGPQSSAGRCGGKECPYHSRAVLSEK
jgi:hypothetical protein